MKADSDVAAAGNAESEQTRMLFLDFLYNSIRGGSRICGRGGGGRSGYRERHRREGFWRVPFEDPLWNFKRGGRAPPAPPPP